MTVWNACYIFNADHRHKEGGETMNGGSEHLNGRSQWERVEFQTMIAHIRCGRRIFTPLCQMRPYGEISARYKHVVVDSLRASWRRAAGEASPGVSSDCSRNLCASRVAGRLFGGRNRDRDERKDEAGVLATLGARLHPSDSAARTEFAYWGPTRTAVPEYPQTRFVVKPVLVDKVSIVGATPFQIKTSPLDPIWPSNRVLVRSTCSPGILKSSGPVLSKPRQSPPCVNFPFPRTLYVQSQCFVS